MSPLEGYNKIAYVPTMPIIDKKEVKEENELKTFTSNKLLTKSQYY